MITTTSTASPARWWPACCRWPSPGHRWRMCCRGPGLFTDGSLRVDLAQRVVIAETVNGGAEQRYPYDQLIVGAGGREPVDRIPGMAEYGFTLRAPGEFERFLDRLASVAGDVARIGPSRATPAPPSTGGGDRRWRDGRSGTGRRRRRPTAREQGREPRRAGAFRCRAVLPGLRAEQPAVAARADRRVGPARCSGPYRGERHRGGRGRRRTVRRDVPAGRGGPRHDRAAAGRACRPGVAAARRRRAADHRRDIAGRAGGLGRR